MFFFSILYSNYYYFFAFQSTAKPAYLVYVKEFPPVVDAPPGPALNPPVYAKLIVCPLGRLYVWLPDWPAEPRIPSGPAWNPCVCAPDAAAPNPPNGPCELNAWPWALPADAPKPPGP